MKFISTRNAKLKVSGAEAIVKGLSDDGGLFVPESFPQVSMGEIIRYKKMDYPERAAAIISKFLPELGENTLLEYSSKAYERFDGDPAPLLKIDDNFYILELWHGPTHAFKDIALTILPYLLTGSKKLVGESGNTLVLVATSGDTGKAALEGFKNVDGTDVIVLYPEQGVSELQKLQMMTSDGKNVSVAAIKGNFDDAQTAVKNIFTDAKASKQIEDMGYKLSSANSINFGRLVPQIVYYFSSYADLLSAKQIEAGDKVNFCVPSGNFGNILAGYYALKMGLPINKLICASNKNNVLTEFIQNGEYSIQREFFKTTSPSMDILISSNLERLLFELCDRNSDLVKKMMDELKNNKQYSISAKQLADMQEVFASNYADENEVSETVSNFFEDYGYIADPHTGVALSVYSEYSVSTQDETPTVIVSTASPYKFVDSVLGFLGAVPNDFVDNVMGFLGGYSVTPATKNLNELEDLTGLPIPDSLSGLFDMEKIHTSVIDKAQSLDFVIDYCKKGNK